jgi:hypothetical protein
MIKLDPEALERLESQHPGVTEQILRFEKATLPICGRCGSDDTAEVNVGIVGRSIAIASGTSKFTLIPDGPKPGRFWCRACSEFFDDQGLKSNDKSACRKPRSRDVVGGTNSMSTNDQSKCCRRAKTEHLLLHRRRYAD